MTIYFALNRWCLLLLFCTGLLSAQVDDKAVLFTVDEEPVMASEFIRVYQKNLDLVKDESQKDVDSYLELFINYQLKVKEAKRLELDKDPKYVREFTNYKNQLTKNYLSDNQVTDALVLEAYERSKTDIKASHILIRLDESVQDTTRIYNQMLEMRDRVMNEGFSQVQKDVHDGKLVYAEDLGYFTVFKMVYPFETAAYNTEPGEVSMPFRTRFGFHIVNVHEKQPSQGQVTVAHIMIGNKQEDATTDPEKRINEIYKMLEQGENFESLAKQFSDDKSTSKGGGKMSPFTRGMLGSEAFENAAFGLENKGDYSKPVRTEFGWHILKLLNKKPIKAFEDEKLTLEGKVKRDSRSKLIKSAQVKKLKARYNVELNSEASEYFISITNEKYFTNSWIVPEDLNKEEIFLTINDKKYTYEDFANFMFKNQRTYSKSRMRISEVISELTNMYTDMQLIQFQRENLENENPEFAHVLKEYRDGLLLFDLMEKQIWNAASADTLGLQSYYENHKSDYMWKDRAEGLALSSSDKTIIEQVISELNNGTEIEAIETKFNSGKIQNLISTKGTFEAGDANVPSDFEFVTGVSKIYFHNNAYHVFKVDKVIPKSPKSLDEAKGKVISDFQNQIESDWVKSLNDRYTVEINKKTLKKVKSQIAN